MPETLATRAGKCTPKEGKFARNLVKYGNQRKAALEAYDTDKPNVADKLAYNNMKKDRVNREIQRITNSVNLKEINQDTWRAAITDVAFGSESEAVRYKGVELGAKVWGLVDDSPKSQINIQLSSINVDESNVKEVAEALTNRLKFAVKVVPVNDLPMSKAELGTSNAIDIGKVKAQAEPTHGQGEAETKPSMD